MSRRGNGGIPVSAFTALAILAALALLIYSTAAICRLRGDLRGPADSTIDAIRFSFGAALVAMIVATGWDLATGDRSYQSVRDWWGISVCFVCAHAILVIHILRGGTKAARTRRAQAQGASQ